MTVRDRRAFLGWFGEPVQPDAEVIGRAWLDRRRRVWVDLTGGQEFLGRVEGREPTWVLRYGSVDGGRVGQPPASPALLGLLHDTGAGVAGAGRRSGRVEGSWVLPVAAGWWPDEREPGRRWWWTAGPVGDGVTLEGLRAQGRVSVPRVAAWTRQLLLAVTGLHAQQLAHLDVKADNVLLVQGRAALMDWGCLTRTNLDAWDGQLRDVAERAAHLQDPAQPVLGTPGSVAPWLSPAWLAAEWLAAVQQDGRWEPQRWARAADVWAVLHLARQLLDSTPVPPLLQQQTQALRDLLEDALTEDPDQVPLPAAVRAGAVDRRAAAGAGVGVGENRAAAVIWPVLLSALGALAVGVVPPALVQRGRGTPTDAGALLEDVDLFVGRSVETDRLRRHLSDELPNGPGLVVTGPAGHGKSALLGHLALTATDPLTRKPLTTSPLFGGNTNVGDDGDLGGNSAGGGIKGVDRDGWVLTRDLDLIADLGHLDSHGQSLPATISAVTELLVQSLALPSGTTAGNVAQQLRLRAEEQQDPVRLILDGLDEAAAEPDPTDQSIILTHGVALARWLDSLCRQLDARHLRLLVGVRTDTPAADALAGAAARPVPFSGTGPAQPGQARPGNWTAPITLADSTRSTTDLTHYLHQLLTEPRLWPPHPAVSTSTSTTTTSGAVMPPASDSRLRLAADRMARSAQGSFLIGQALALGHGDLLRRGGPLPTDAPATLDDAFGGWLNARFRGTAYPPAVLLLSTVAHLGTVPDQSLPLLLNALAEPGSPAFTSQDVTELLTDPATSGLRDFLTRTWLQDDQGNQLRALRIRHDQLATWLRDYTQQHLDWLREVGEAHRRLGTALLDNPTSRQAPWARNAALHHATRAAVPDGRPGHSSATPPVDLAARAWTDIDLLVLVDTTTARTEATRAANLPLPPRAQGLPRLLLILRPDVWERQGPAERIQQLLLLADRHPQHTPRGLRHLLHEAARRSPSSTWRHVHAAPVTEPPGLLVDLRRRATAMATLRVSQATHIITGDARGDVRSWTLSGLPAFDAVYEGEIGLVGRHPQGRAVTALGAERTLQGGLVVAAYEQGDVYLWNAEGGAHRRLAEGSHAGLPSGHQPRDHSPAVAEVKQIAVLRGDMGDPVVVALGADWSLRVFPSSDGWRPRYIASSPFISGSRVTCFTTTNLQAKEVIITSHADGSVRGWTATGAPHPLISRLGEPGLIANQDKWCSNMVTLELSEGPVVYTAQRDCLLFAWDVKGGVSSQVPLVNQTGLIGTQPTGQLGVSMAALRSAFGPVLICGSLASGHIYAYGVEHPVSVEGEPTRLLPDRGARCSLTHVLVAEDAAPPMIVTADWDGTISAWAVDGRPHPDLRPAQMPDVQKADGYELSEGAHYNHRLTATQAVMSRHHGHIYLVTCGGSEPVLWARNVHEVGQKVVAGARPTPIMLGRSRAPFRQLKCLALEADVSVILTLNLRGELEAWSPTGGAHSYVLADWAAQAGTPNGSIGSHRPDWFAVVHIDGGPLLVTASSDEVWAWSLTGQPHSAHGSAERTRRGQQQRVGLLYNPPAGMTAFTSLELATGPVLVTGHDDGSVFAFPLDRSGSPLRAHSRRPSDGEPDLVGRHPELQEVRQLAVQRAAQGPLLTSRHMNGSTMAWVARGAELMNGGHNNVKYMPVSADGALGVPEGPLRAEQDGTGVLSIWSGRRTIDSALEDRALIDLGAGSVSSPVWTVVDGDGLVALGGPLTLVTTERLAATIRHVRPFARGTSTP